MGSIFGPALGFKIRSVDDLIYRGATQNSSRFFCLFLLQYVCVSFNIIRLLFSLHDSQMKGRVDRSETDLGHSLLYTENSRPNSIRNLVRASLLFSPRSTHLPLIKSCNCFSISARRTSPHATCCIQWLANWAADNEMECITPGIYT